MARIADYYVQEDDGCRCFLCPHKCLIPPNMATGLCGARATGNGILYADNYGRLTGLALDPIEKKPLNKFYPGSFILSVGSYGCNMHCGFCQNSDISQGCPKTEYFSPEDLLQTASSLENNLGVAFTYNEPLISMEYLMDAMPLLKEAGLKTVLVTNGMANPDIFKDLLPLTDAMNIDLKSFSPEFYCRHGGYFDTVLKNITAAAGSCHLEVTTLIIPGENDGDEEMERLSEWLATISPGLPLHLSRFFPRYRMTEKAPTPVATLKRLKTIASRHLRDVYIGNV